MSIKSPRNTHSPNAFHHFAVSGITTVGSFRNQSGIRRIGRGFSVELSSPDDAARTTRPVPSADLWSLPGSTCEPWTVTYCPLPLHPRVLDVHVSGSSTVSIESTAPCGDRNRHVCQALPSGPRVLSIRHGDAVDQPRDHESAPFDTGERIHSRYCRPVSCASPVSRNRATDPGRRGNTLRTRQDYTGFVIMLTHNMFRDIWSRGISRHTRR